MASERQERMDNVRQGTVLRHKSGGVITIARRKEDDTGWWNTDGSGLIDSAIASEDWVIVAQGGDKAVEREVAEVARMLAVMHGMAGGATNFYPAAREVVKERDNLRRHGAMGQRMGFG